MKPKKRNEFDEEISRVLSEMKGMYSGSKDYENAAANLKVLCESKESKSRDSISKDALLAAGTNILGILLILNFERMGVITSKAITFVSKGK